MKEYLQLFAGCLVGAILGRIIEVGLAKYFEHRRMMKVRREHFRVHNLSKD